MVAIQNALEQSRNESAWVQVVAEVLGKNSGIDLEAFVAKRQRLMQIDNIKKIFSRGKKHEDEGTG